jgi:DDE superfamily endonuclease
LTKWALQYHAWGLPLQISHLKQFALEILLRRKIPHPYIGKNWHLQFLTRNPQLKVKLSSPLDRSRMSSCTPENLKSFYDLYLQIVTEHQIKPANTWNMDEKGTLMGCITREHILVPKEEKKAFIRQDGKREWVSSLECVSAGGDSIKTFLIVKATYIKEDYFNSGLDITIHTSPKGWTSIEAALTWLKHHFEPQTRDLTDSTASRLLIVDGHDSHCSIGFIEFCYEHNICLLILPPHTTHILQPLDVGIFRPLSRAYTEILDRYNRWNGRWIDKASFIEYYTEARKTALTYTNIISAFKATGIHPYTPSMTLEKLRPYTPPCQITINAKGQEPIII